MHAPIFVFVSLSGCDTQSPNHNTTSAITANTSEYAAEKQRLDQQVAILTERSSATDEAWLPLEHLAEALMERARLTGDLDNYTLAQDALDEAYKRAPKGAGPHLAQAALAYAQHRYDDIPKLAGPSLLDSSDMKASKLSLLGATMMETGRYDDAEALLTEADTLSTSPTNLGRLAMFHNKMGDPDQAQAHLDEALHSYHGRSPAARAWFHLQMGILDLEAQRYEAALQDYLAADDALGDWWLVQEHIAEIVALQGHHGEALGMYEVVVAETGSPQLMAAQANTLQELGRLPEAYAVKRQAIQSMNHLIDKHPDSAGGHGIALYLEFNQPDRALELALQNANRRPNGDALSQLAEAYLATGDLQAAQQVVDEIAETDWDSAASRDATEAVYDAIEQSRRAMEVLSSWGRTH